MRRLHPISEHEQTIAQGAYSYLPAGERSGGEEWELTRLPDGGSIHRVDVAEGEGLWHLMLGPDGRPDRLMVRLHDEAGRRFDATYTFFDTEVMVSGGQVGRQPETNVVELPEGFGLIWGPFAGRGLAFVGHGDDADTRETLPLYLMRSQAPGGDWLSARLAECSVEHWGRRAVNVPAGSFEAEEVSFAVPGWSDQQGWFDEHGTVLQWKSGGQIQAVLNRYWRFD